MILKSVVTIVLNMKSFPCYKYMFILNIIFHKLTIDFPKSKFQGKEKSINRVVGEKIEALNKLHASHHVKGVSCPKRMIGQGSYK